MKILMINSVCGIRSTGRICTDLATVLEAAGHEVRIAYGRESIPVQYKKYAVRIGTDFDVNLHGVKARIADADGLGSKAATKKFLKWVEGYNPDVIHLHNLHGYYINVPLLFDYIINNNKKVIWTLHDMWPFTGHSGTCDIHNCERWKSGCGNCPAYKGYPSSIKDASLRNYLWKKELFTKVEDLTIVTPSKWLAGLVKQSFLKDNKIVVIPNGIDIKQFRPLKNDFKEFYGIKNKIVLMGCATWWGESKGLNDFYALADKLDTLLSFFSVGLIPSGSNDPYALRRATQGIVRILDAFGWHIPMDELIDSLYGLSFDSLSYDNQAEVINFIKARVDKMMGRTSKDIKEAVLAGSNFVVADMLEAADALSEAAKADGYKAAVESLSRAFNLAEKADASVAVDDSLFENDQEKALAKAIEELELTGSASDKLAQLFALSPVIDAFFDNTMVMAEDEAVKNNRLALLAGLVAKANAVAAFNQLNTK